MVARFFKKHFLTILVIVSTAIAQIVLNFVTNVSIMENFVMSAVLGLNMTFLFDFARNIDDTSEKVEDLNRILPESRIEVYESVDAVAKQFKQIVHDGHHTVDIVLFDTKVRTSDPTKVSKMQRFISDCTNNPRIKLRMTFVPAEDSICERIENALNAIKKQNNSYFAFQRSTVSFASFLIIDNEIMSIRTPFKNGSPTSYCIIRETELCKLFSSWFSVLWNESTYLTDDTIQELCTEYYSAIGAQRYNSILRQLEV